jgi:ABC-type Fe3+-hydroxamate transport system substrate-binding protein
MFVDETGRRVNVAEHPQRLVSLAHGIAETIYALGLGDQLDPVTFRLWYIDPTGRPRITWAAARGPGARALDE